MVTRWDSDLFLSNRKNLEKPPQIYLISIDGGEACPLTNIKGIIGSYAWSPDGKQLLCQVRKIDKEVLERERDPQKKELGVVSRQYDRPFYKFDGIGYLPHERWHLWVVNARTGSAKQITDHKIFDEGGPPAWSPDGKKIVFTSNRSVDPDIQIEEIDLFTIGSQGGKMKKIPAPVGRKAMPVYSHDGKWIAYFGREGKGNWWKNTSLWIVPSDGSAPPRNLTENYDVQIDAHTLTDMGGQEMVPPIWSKGDDRILFTVDKNGSTTLNSIDRQGQNLQEIVGSPGAVGSVTLDKGQTRIGFLQASLTDPGQVYCLDLGTGKTRQITRLNSWLNLIDLGTIEETWFKGSDANNLQGWILKPPGFNPRRKYPSILEIHGGPLLQYGHHFMFEFFFLAASGNVVYFCNPRGGQGYGEDHSKAIWGAWGTVDYKDVMKWADLVSKKPYISKSKMGVTGGSYGGYMTLWIIGHTKRFKAAVAQRVVSNFISMWGTSDGNWMFQQVLNDIPPYKDPMNAWDRSPMKYIENVVTPTLIIHSESDHRTPIEQGEQAYIALRTRGVATKMVRFPNEPHGLSRDGRTDRKIVRLNEILGWFEKHLG